MIRLRVKEIAKQKNISMGKLSRLADVSYKTVQRIYNEHGYTPSLPVLSRIAKVLGVATSELIEDVEEQ